jgi:hypothetical protein
MGIYHARAARFVAPVEPSTEHLAQQQHLAAIDRELGLIGDIPPLVRTPQMWARLDELLDERLAVTARPQPLRPSVPVIPGRPS